MPYPEKYSSWASRAAGATHPDAFSVSTVSSCYSQEDLSRLDDSDTSSIGCNEECSALYPDLNANFRPLALQDLSTSTRAAPAPAPLVKKSSLQQSFKDWARRKDRIQKLREAEKKLEVASVRSEVQEQMRLQKQKGAADAKAFKEWRRRKAKELKAEKDVAAAKEAEAKAEAEIKASRRKELTEGCHEEWVRRIRDIEVARRRRNIEEKQQKEAEAAEKERAAR